MASPLTSTSLKSSFLYFVLLICAITGVLYLLFFQKPGIQENFYQQAFRLNYSAFASGIRFANIRFITNDRKNSNLDQWLDDGVGLDYNDKGFPIGTEITDSNQQLPLTAEQCRQIWLFVLGPLRPELFLATGNEAATHNAQYGVQLTAENICTYHSTKVKNLQIHYRAMTGKVTLTAING